MRRHWWTGCQQTDGKTERSHHTPSSEQVDATTHTDGDTRTATRHLLHQP